MFSRLWSIGGLDEAQNVKQKGYQEARNAERRRKQYYLPVYAQPVNL